MSDNETNKSNSRFFASSVLIKNEHMREGSVLEKGEDPKPFGLELQESVSDSHNMPMKQGMSTHPSPTNTPSGSDTCFDIDFEF
jgi:hypothetical protein